MSNVPVTPYFTPPANFVPKIATISGITNANPAVVTTDSNHNYGFGNIVRIDIYNKSMPQMNGLSGLATVLSPTTFSIPIDSTNFGVFSSVTKTKAQCVPIAELAVTLKNAVDNIAM